MSRTFFLLIPLLMALGACSSSFEFRKRADNSEVAVLRDIQKVFPVFANQFQAELDATNRIKNELEQLLGIKLGYQNQVVQLYEKQDQLQAATRDFIISNYVVYINTELENDVDARERGRASWRATNDTLAKRTFELRRIREDLLRLKATATTWESALNEWTMAVSLARKAEAKLHQVNPGLIDTVFCIPTSIERNSI